MECSLLKIWSLRQNWSDFQCLFVNNQNSFTQLSFFVFGEKVFLICGAWSNFESGTNVELFFFNNPKVFDKSLNWNCSLTFQFHSIRFYREYLPRELNLRRTRRFNVLLVGNTRYLDKQKGFEMFPHSPSRFIPSEIRNPWLVSVDFCAIIVTVCHKYIRSRLCQFFSKTYKLMSFIVSKQTNRFSFFLSSPLLLKMFIEITW